ncbi:MAG TPA: hypothetical protein VKT51_05540 [Candidatus Eremiobacteraceae bacterium]|nr:hypothetical protein [Candidatus Eremiobacteraceae bacterium]
MPLKAFAFVTACSLIASLAVGPAGAQGSSQTLSPSICGTGDLAGVVAIYDFDSPTYRSAPTSVPAGVKSYLAQLLTGRLQACAEHAGPAAATACSPAPRESDPHALWEQLKFCEGVLGLTPLSKSGVPLVSAQEPTFYVVLGVGAGPGGPPGGQSSGGGGKGGGGGGATGSTSTGSSVDNPAYFLLFLVAQRLERDICARSGVSMADCDAQHPVAVLPESTWNLEDLRTQCADDPYVANDPANPYGGPGNRSPAGHGTLGAIVLNGSTVTADGTFAVFTVYGSSEANYSAQAVECSSGSAPFLSTVWSDNISNGNKTTALSFFPIALAGTLIAAHSAAKEASLPAPNPSSSPSVLSTYINYQTDVALGTFAANTSSLALGNPSSGLTFRHTFEAWSTSLAHGLDAFCKVNSAQNICKALKLPTSP